MKAYILDSTFNGDFLIWDLRFLYKLQPSTHPKKFIGLENPDRKLI